MACAVSELLLSMKTLRYVLAEGVPRHDRQMLTVAVAGSTLLVFITAALNLIGS